MTTNLQRVLDLIDAGLGHGTAGHQGGMSSMNLTRCPRQDCTRPPVEGHDFCAPCLAWLRGDEDEDPLNAKPPPPAAPTECRPPAGVNTDEWYECLEAAIAAHLPT